MDVELDADLVPDTRRNVLVALVDKPPDPSEVELGQRAHSRSPGR